MEEKKLYLRPEWNEIELTKTDVLTGSNDEPIETEEDEAFEN